MSQPRTASIFSLSSSYLPYCASTAFVWLGDPVAARMWAGQSVEARNVPPQPTVGRAIARFDLAIALAQSGEPEEAAAVGVVAIEICANRLTVPARRRAEELLAALAAFTEPSVKELRERWQWTSR